MDPFLHFALLLCRTLLTSCSPFYVNNVHSLLSRSLGSKTNKKKKEKDLYLPQNKTWTKEFLGLLLFMKSGNQFLNSPICLRCLLLAWEPNTASVSSS